MGIDTLDKTSSEIVGWPSLQSHDVVDIIAPASKCIHQDDLEKIRPFISSWDLECHIPKNIFGEHIFCANSDDIRFKHLQNALTNTQSKAIWCLRGGYGSMKLIPMLAKMEKPKTPKIFIGSSDITALHIFLQDKWGWSTIHGPSIHSAVTGKVSPESLDLLKEIIFKKTISFAPSNMTPLNKLAEKETVISAPITGGNLTLIQASLGTPWQINTKNKILLIEEVNERGYRIDRALEQLKQAGIIHQAKAVLFGDFIGGKESDGESLVPEALKLFTQTCPVPVLQMSGVGHGFVNNPIVLGCHVEMKVG